MNKTEKYEQVQISYSGANVDRSQAFGLPLAQTQTAGSLDRTFATRGGVTTSTIHGTKPSTNNELAQST